MSIFYKSLIKTSVILLYFWLWPLGWFSHKLYSLASFWSDPTAENNVLSSSIYTKCHWYLLLRWYLQLHWYLFQFVLIVSPGIKGFYLKTYLIQIALRLRNSQVLTKFLKRGINLLPGDEFWSFEAILSFSGHYDTRATLFRLLCRDPGDRF